MLHKITPLVFPNPILKRKITATMKDILTYFIYSISISYFKIAITRIITNSKNAKLKSKY